MYDCSGKRSVYRSLRAFCQSWTVKRKSISIRWDQSTASWASTWKSDCRAWKLKPSTPTAVNAPRCSSDYSPVSEWVNRHRAVGVIQSLMNQAVVQAVDATLIMWWWWHCHDANDHTDVIGSDDCLQWLLAQCWWYWLSYDDAAWNILSVGFCMNCGTFACTIIA